MCLLEELLMRKKQTVKIEITDLVRTHLAEDMAVHISTNSLWGRVDKNKSV